MSYANTTYAPPKPPVRKRFSLVPTEGWTTVVLASTLVLITVGAIQSYAWTPNIGILTSTTLMGLLLGLIIAKQHVLPQSLADIPALAIGIFYALYQTATVDAGGDVRTLFSHLIAWFGVATSGRNSNDDAIFLLFLGILTMLLGYVTMWLIFRSRSPWLAVIANCVVLLINLNNESDDKIIFAILFLLVTILLLVRFNLVEHMRVWRQKGLRYSPELGWDFMQVGVIFAIIVMIFSVALPTSAANAAISNVWSSPSGPWSFVQNKFNQVFNIHGSGGPNVVAFGSSLSIQGSVNLPNTVVMTYTTNDTTNSFIEALTFDTFDGHNWTTGPTIRNPVGVDETISIESDVVRKVVQTFHVINPAIGDYALAGGEAGQFSMPIIARSDGIGLKDGDAIGSYTDWRAAQPIAPNSIYTATSNVSAATADQLRAVPSPDSTKGVNLYPAKLLERYTQLPDDLGGSESQTAQTAHLWSDDQKTMFDKLEGLITNFHNNFTYTTTPGAVPVGTDAANYLLNIKKGYCTWFATGFTMMARSLGFPARVAEGFAPGTVDPKTGIMTIHGTDAHMWSQVYFPHYGWINFEPSAGFTGLANLPTTTSTTPGGNTGPDAPTRPTKGTTSTPPLKPTNPSTGTGQPKGQSKPINPIVRGIGISLTLLIVVALLLSLAVATWWRIIFRSLSPTSQTFARMALLGRLAGVKSPPAQTAGEYGAALSQQLPAQKSAIDEITEHYIYERWAPDPLPPSATIGERWQALQRDLLRTIARRRPRFNRWKDDETSR